MANGAGRLFDVMKKTGEASKGVSSKLVSLKVKSKEPLIFQIDDRLEITEEFCYFSNSADKELLNIGDIVIAVALNNGQSYYIQHNLDGLLTTVAELNFLQGATDNIQNQIDKIKTSGVATGDTLPIGSVVEFTGDQVPENWEEVEYNELIVKDVEPTTGQEVWLQKGKNLFNGNYINASIGGTSGRYFSHSDSGRMAIIKVKPNATYTITKFANTGIGNRFIIAQHKDYLMSGVEIESENILLSNNTNITSKTITTGSNINYLYVMVTADVSNIPYLQIEQGTEATEYASYVENKILTKNSDGEYEDFMKESVIISPIEPTNRRDVWIQKGKNLFNKDNVLRGYELAGETGANYASAEWYISEYIEITPNTTYYISGNKTRGNSNCFYDENKVYISTASAITGTITSPSNAKYLRFNGTLAELNNNIQLEQNEEGTSYEEYVDRVIYLLNSNNNEYEKYMKVEDSLTSSSKIDALSANQGRILEGRLGAKQNKPTYIYTGDTNAGFLVYFSNKAVQKMMFVKIYGNGYQVTGPLDILIQGYHYQPEGYFLACKQHTNSGNTGQCKFMIYNNKIALWIPRVGPYMTYFIDVYEGGNKIDFSYQWFASEPDGTNKTNCTVV